MKRGMIRWGCLAAFAGWLAVSGAAFGAGTNKVTKVIIIGGKQYTTDQVEADYQLMKRKYALSHHRRVLAPLGELEGTLISGVVEQVSGSRMIVRTKTGVVAVVKKGVFTAGNKPVTLAVKALGTYSWRDREGGRQSIPQYRDMTLTRGEFLRELRKGYPFAGMKTVKTIPARNTQLNADRGSQFKKAGPGKALETDSQFERRRTDIKGR